MKVMTYNITHGEDYRIGKIDLPLYARVIGESGVDLCGLNEVRSAAPVPDYADQVRALAEPNGLYHHFGEAIRFGGIAPYGNALVSRVPFKEVETIPIPDPEVKDEPGYYETRCIIRAVVELDGQDVCLLVTHMGLNMGEKRNAVEALCRLIDACELPLIVMGDFNAQPGHDILRPLRERLADSTLMDARPNTPTFPSDAPDRKLDYILYRGLRCIRAETCDWPYSDHLPLMAEFEHL